MTHCHNCGHTGTFVLLVEFALSVPGPVSDPAVPDGRVGTRPADAGRRPRRRRPGDRHRRDAPVGAGRPHPQEESPRRNPLPPRDGFPFGGDLSLSVQCPACDSTDVDVAAADLLARHGSSTTS